MGQVYLVVIADDAWTFDICNAIALIALLDQAGDFTCYGDVATSVKRGYDGAKHRPQSCMMGICRQPSCQLAYNRHFAANLAQHTRAIRLAVDLEMMQTISSPGSTPKSKKK